MTTSWHRIQQQAKNSQQRLDGRRSDYLATLREAARCSRWNNDHPLCSALPKPTQKEAFMPQDVFTSVVAQDPPLLL